jgi:hypothetical protein
MLLLEFFGAEGGRYVGAFIAPKGPIVVAPSLQKPAKTWLTTSAPDLSGAPLDRVHEP